MLSENKGIGGFSLLGDTESAMGIISDCTLFKPFVIKEFVNELILDIGQYTAGSASYYQMKDDTYNFEHGLNAYMNYPHYYGYKRIEANIRLLNFGFSFRENFFKRLPIKLENDFFEKAANVLNPKPLTIPRISFICNQLKECTLEGDALKLFIHGKAFEVFSILYDYIYKANQHFSVHLSVKDKAALTSVKEYIEIHFAEDFTIAGLTKKFGLNQQKLVTGFKELFHTTINTYTKKMRMAKAIELLKSSELPVAEIAKAVGYYGDGFFQKAFKETYGITPKKMRKDL